MTKDQELPVNAAVAAIIQFAKLAAAIGVITGVIVTVGVYLFKPAVPPMLDLPELVRTYQNRQSLRDVTKQAAFPANVAGPSVPV